MRRGGRGRCYEGKVFGDPAADDASGVAAIGAVQFDRELALITAIVFLVGNVDHIEAEGRRIRMLLLMQVVSHCFFQVALYFRCREFPLTAGGNQAGDNQERDG